MAAPLVPWVADGEAANSAVTKRPLKYILTASGMDVDTTGFTGFLPVYNPRAFGALGDGVTNDTAAFLSAVAQAQSDGKGVVHVPAGNYVWVSQVTLATGTWMIGSGSGKTRIIFRPTADGSCLTVSAGAALSYNNRVSGLRFYSDDLTYTKVALELVDVSSCKVDDIDISGTGTGTPAGNYWTGGTGSIGIKTRGREATCLNNIKVVADYPIYIGQNPNTVPNDGEDMDHWQWSNLYLVAKGHYSITVQAGLGLSNVMFDGYQAWVGGVGGFFMNDTRAAPTVPSRHIVFKNVRGEQCQDPNGWWWNITAVSAIQTLGFKNCLGASTAQGISINGVLQCSFDLVTMATAAGKVSLQITGAIGASVVRMIACNWQPGSTFTMTGYTATSTGGFNSATTAGPSNATFVNVLAGSQFTAEKFTGIAAVGAAVADFGSTTGSVLRFLANAAGAGIEIRSITNALSDFEPLKMSFSTLGLWYRTGVATLAQAAQIDTSGQFSLLKRFLPGTPAGAFQTAAGVYGGTGVPSNTDGSNGDFYLRSDGGASTAIYQKRAGAWVGIV